MEFGVLSFKLPGAGTLPSLLEALPQLGVNGNVLQSLQGTLGKGLGSIVFSNGDAMLRGFSGFAEGPKAAFGKVMGGFKMDSIILKGQMPWEGKGVGGIGSFGR